MVRSTQNERAALPVAASSKTCCTGKVLAALAITFLALSVIGVLGLYDKIPISFSTSRILAIGGAVGLALTACGALYHAKTHANVPVTPPPARLHARHDTHKNPIAERPLSPQPPVAVSAISLLPSTKIEVSTDLTGNEFRISNEACEVGKTSKHDLECRIIRIHRDHVGIHAIMDFAITVQIGGAAPVEKQLNDLVLSSGQDYSNVTIKVSAKPNSQGGDIIKFKVQEAPDPNTLGPISIQIDKKATVRQLKERLAAQKGAQAHQAQLLFGGKILDDTRVLSDLDLQDNSVVYVHFS